MIQRCRVRPTTGQAPPRSDQKRHSRTTPGPWTGAQPDRSGPDTEHQRRVDRGPPPPTAGTAPPSYPPPLHASRPDDPRGPGEATPPRPLADLPGHPVDAAALAPRNDPPTMDLPAR